MALTYLFSEAYIKQYTILNENVDYKIIAPYVIYCEHQYILNSLGGQIQEGGGLYGRLITAIDLDPSLSSAPNAILKHLMDAYISDIMKWCLLYEITIPLTYKYCNIGVVVRSGDSADAPSMQDLQTLRDSHKHKAQFYMQRMTDYLMSQTSLHPDYFPEYVNPGSTIDTIWAQKNNVESTIFLEVDMWPRFGYLNYEQLYQGTGVWPFKQGYTG